MGGTLAVGAAPERDLAPICRPRRCPCDRTEYPRATSRGGCASGVSQPLILALDTSTSTASVAFFDGERVLSETTWLAGREHSTRLLIAVEIALERRGKSVEQLTGLAVAPGPGSVTGGPVGIRTADGTSRSA